MKAKVESSELHTFCDASEEAFSAVVYLRSLYADGNVVCSMVMDKTKIVPKKALSVARLELQAALLGARSALYDLTRPVNRLVFWTDSKCVIGWVRSTAVWYKPFVAHRVGEIQTLTDSKSWRHVPGRLNISDCATRSRIDGKTEPIIPGRWFTGPEFLYQSEDRWPKEIPIEETRQPLEMKPSKVFVASSDNDSAFFPADVDLARCSTLWKAQRVMAQVHRFVALCKGAKPTSGVLTVKELRVAIVALVRQCQRDAFPDKLESLEKNKTVDRHSKLLSFTPYLDENKVIRTGGRLDRAKLPYEVRHPIILPQKHRLSELVIECYHRIENHGGVDHVVAAIRHKFWIIHGRQEVKNLKRKCQKRKREGAQAPASPHWGGVHESLVKSVKRALYRTLDPKEKTKRSNPTGLQLSSLFAEVKRFVNSWPITYVSSDPEDIEALTPYHFWLQRRSPVIPLGDYNWPSFPDRFRQTQHLANVVWQQWVKLYLPTLLTRKKWKTEERNLLVNDVVLVFEPNLKRGEWKLGRVLEVFPGRDKRVRAAKIKTSEGIYTRPITKLCVLEEGKQTDHRRPNQIETNDGEE